MKAQWIRLAINLATWGAFVAVFHPLIEATGDYGVGALIMVPVALTAWSWGLWVGVAGALAGNALNAYMFGTVGFEPATWWGVAVPSLAVFFVAGIVGYARNLRGRLQEQRSEILHRARHDGLTGLLTRVALMEQAERTLATGSGPTGVFFVDLDGFKAINDTHGHAAGDDILRELARRFGATLRNTDLIARLGGDEFVVVASGLAHPEDAVKVARNLMDAISVPHAIGAIEMPVSASIGISLHPSDGEDVKVLLKRADAALYRVKREGGGGYHLFDATLDREANLKYQLLNDLRGALERSELELVYQPQMALPNGATSGFEALVRWNHPQLGELSPGAFLELAEEHGLIVPIGEWVLREACRQAKAWDEAGHDVGTIAVNVSAAQLTDGSFVERTTRALDDAGLDADRLELELTETMLIQDFDRAVRTIRELEALGVRFAIDDFGIGYSSLDYLRKLPLDTLKIDRAFIADLTTSDKDSDQSLAIIRAIIDLAHGLRMRVVAEGVETEAQLALLEEAGCNYAQGYLLARPMKMSRIGAWLARSGDSAVACDDLAIAPPVPVT